MSAYPVQDVDPRGGGDVSTLLPRREDIPAPVWDGNGPWWRVVSTWFFEGLDGVRLVAKPGVDKAKALRHLAAILRSFEPAHEHKTAGVAFLLSQWFEPVSLAREPKP